MCAFRETFSRPVRAIRFLGLFDTVNSVPAFENAWMQRSKFPYTARSSARVIRHAVAIDERRAKFRQDLISQEKPDHSMHYKRHHKHGKNAPRSRNNVDGADEKVGDDDRSRPDALSPPLRFTNPHETIGVRGLSPGYDQCDGSHDSHASSILSLNVGETWNSQEDEGEQDIQEVWFPGCHAVSHLRFILRDPLTRSHTIQDIGGGWPLGDDDAALSHVPLVWMVREAQKAGLEFDEDKLEALHCYYEEPLAKNLRRQVDVPTIEIDPVSPHSDIAQDTTSGVPSSETIVNSWTDEDNILSHHRDHPDTPFHNHLHSAATQGRIHDVLQFHNGAGRVGVASWNFMEYLPFRRMDLQEDGTWKAIRWPLPKGETRDVPATAVIHSSVIKRMLADSKYRPGNLIVGGGGRGLRQAPTDQGMGKWVVAHENGHHVGECFVRKQMPKSKKSIRMETKIEHAERP